MIKHVMSPLTLALAAGLLFACTAPPPYDPLSFDIPTPYQGAARVVLTEGLQIASPGPGYALPFRNTRTGMVADIWGIGSEHIYSGTVSLALPDDHGGGIATFVSDSAYPLHFKVVEEVGYVYLCGHGRVTWIDGQDYALGQDEDADTWIPRLSDERQHVREGAAEALGYLGQGSTRARKALVKALQDSAWEVRRDAAESLGLLRDAEAIPALEAILEDDNDTVAKVAQKSIYDIQGATDCGSPSSWMDRWYTAQTAEEEAAVFDYLKECMSSPRYEVEIVVLDRVGNLLDTSQDHWWVDLERIEVHIDGAILSIKPIEAENALILIE